MKVDALSVVMEARSFLRPPGWRDTDPEPADLDGSLVFPRDRRVRSFDGTGIAYSVHGSSGPWVALVPGFVCNDTFWTYLVPALSDAYQVIVWDPRGLGASGLPRPPGYRARNLSREDFTIENLSRDLEAVLDQEAVDAVALIGHSMGGQTILESYRRFPRRVSALVSLTGPFESPLRTFYGHDFAGMFRAFSTMVYAMPRPAAVALWRTLLLANPPFTHRVAQMLRALGPDARVQDMAKYYRHLAYLDPLVVAKMAEAMHQHSAAEVLPTVTVPTLIVAATLDTFTPVSLARSMHEQIAHSELVVVEGASHGAVVEKPSEVNAAVRSFLDRHLMAAAPSTG
ncbi:MAG TPA: alpha/beta hydrolase [Actinomycetota bacterium]|nr:alpha/beta hydrolase [Actinomycetota bacterium]